MVLTNFIVCQLYSLIQPRLVYWWNY